MNRYKYRLMGIPVLIVFALVAFASGALPIALFTCGAMVGHVIGLSWVMWRDRNPK